MTKLSSIRIERQQHPRISALKPFDIAWEYSYKPEKEFRGDMHYALQIGVVIHGAVELVMDDFSRTFNPGEMFWTMCWEPHAYRLLKRRNFVLAINIDIDNLGDCGHFSDCDWLAPFIISPEKRFCPETEEERMNAVRDAKKLFHICCRKPLNWQPEAWLSIHQLILKAISSIGKNGDLSGSLNMRNGFWRIKPAINMVRSTESRLPNLGDAAKACSLSPSRFSEIFRRSMGVSYGQFTNKVRIANAAKDLMAGNRTTEEVAIKWGFFDSAHFCNSFKKYYKSSPKQFIPHDGI